LAQTPIFFQGKTPFGAFGGAQNFQPRDSHVTEVTTLIRLGVTNFRVKNPSPIWGFNTLTYPTREAHISSWNLWTLRRGGFYLPHGTKLRL